MLSKSTRGATSIYYLQFNLRKITLRPDTTQLSQTHHGSTPATYVHVYVMLSLIKVFVVSSRCIQCKEACDITVYLNHLGYRIMHTN